MHGLILVGEVGEADEFGLGAEVEMRPETNGNPKGAKLDFTKAYGLGW